MKTKHSPHICSDTDCSNCEDNQCTRRDPCSECKAGCQSVECRTRKLMSHTLFSRGKKDCTNNVGYVLVVQFYPTQLTPCSQVMMTTMMMNNTWPWETAPTP